MTEKENDGKHGIWFNRGVVASRAYSVELQNRELTEEMYNQVDDNNRVTEETSKWLSRGLEEACVNYINGIPKGEMIRVCAASAGRACSALSRCDHASRLHAMEAGSRMGASCISPAAATAGGFAQR